jgi:hypothetical protein
MYRCVLPVQQLRLLHADRGCVFVAAICAQTGPDLSRDRLMHAECVAAVAAVVCWFCSGC